ncbi:MAG TPA: transaldolase [Acidimicrobiales bacterium]|nr:transaldolase [Acidimicrobiales bacterium]
MTRTRLHDLFEAEGQSPWIDNLTRTALRNGDLQRLVDQGIRGVTSNPTIFQKAIAGSDAYDDQFGRLIREKNVEEAYWDVVFDDIRDALQVLRPVYDESGGTDGFVSLELSPSLARDTETSTADARRFHETIAEPNLMVKIPGTAEGLPAIRQMIAEGRNINVTLIFSVERYAEVIEAYLAGLEQFAAGGGELSSVASVASFFISRVDTEVDRRLEEIGTPEALELRGKAAVAQAKLAYALHLDTIASDRWKALAAKRARAQRPLWASTSTKNPSYPDLLYVDTLIGPDTVNTMPDATVEAFLDHGTVARTVDVGLDDARRTLDRISEVGVNLADVAVRLEDEGVAAFVKSFDELIQSLQDKASSLS